MYYSVRRKRGSLLPKLLLITFISLATLLLIAVCVLDMLSYDREEGRIEEFCQSLSYERVENDGYISYLAKNSEKGLIFYPGGLVDEGAYEPLMASLASKGISTFLVPMPLDLAVLNMNGADGIIEDNEAISDWYVGGHSLGGAMAANYLKSNCEDFKGLVLLAAYSTEDLTNENIRVLSIYGTRDCVLNMEKYANCKQNLPKTAEESIIYGGNHAGFGMYGVQKGDGRSGLDTGEQIEIAAEIIGRFIKE